MLKKISLTSICLLATLSTIVAQDSKEDLKQYIDNMESIEDARFQLEKQVEAIDLLESLNQIQSIKITSGDKEDAKSSNSFDEGNASTAFLIPTNINADSIKVKFADYLNNNTFHQDLTPPKSSIYVPYYSSDISDILGISLSNNDCSANITVHKIYYANGTIEEPHSRFALGEEYTIDNAKFIDSIQVEATINYPTNVEHISLSKKNPTFGKGDNTIQLSSMKGREADIVLPQNVYNNLIIIQAKDKKGRVMDYTSRSYSSHYSPAMSAYFQEIGKLSNVIIKNIDDSIYNSLDDLKKDIFDKFSTDIPEDDQSYTAWVQFKNTISELDIFYATSMDSVKVFTTVVNRDLQSKTAYYCVTDPDTYKYGIIDNSGNWIIQPQYDALQPYDSLFFQGYKDSENENFQTYKLDATTKTLHPYKYHIKDTLLNNYYLISESVNSASADSVSENSEKVGIMDKNENIIIPVSKEWIYSFDNFFAVQDSLVGLYNETGKMLLPEIYTEVNVIDGYTYATIDTDNRSITSIFDTDMHQITKDTWDAQTRFSDHSDLVLTQDENADLFYINKQGDVVIPTSSEYIFSEEFWFGATSIYTEDSNGVRKYGYVNDKGDVIIEPQYDNILPFQGEYAYVEKKGKAMLVDKNNTIFKKLPSTLDSWGDTLDSDPSATRYYLENNKVFDGYGNVVEDIK